MPYSYPILLNHKRHRRDNSCQIVKERSDVGLGRILKIHGDLHTLPSISSTKLYLGQKELLSRSLWVRKYCVVTQWVKPEQFC